MNKNYNLWGKEESSKIVSKLNIAERDARVKAFMQSFFERASNQEYKILDLVTEKELDEVFSSDIWGFREIILVIVIARLLNTN